MAVISVEIRDFHIEYPDRLLFDSINLSVADDELVAIAGLPAWQVPALIHRDYEVEGDTLGWLCEFNIADRFG